MDTCDKQKDKLLRDYFMNRLSAEETEAFQFHLFHCQRCQEKLKRMRQLAHDEEDALSVEAGETKSSESIYPWWLAAWMRIAALVGLLFVLAAGGYYYLSTPSEEEWAVEMDEAPVLHSGDSVQMEADSMHVDVKDKENGHVE